ncbi:ImmA/IrrE family metallo-endopeptidase [Zhihengliuella sp.]|uniref:ImmA/IrrE family metallo-endopeptidase n=1 Tax=Zhihengliuella sp. TaxID=1954483 RepID=UPI002811105B|nr:ImmA/IrrE family metallo-endopeptidase [Zhihengliuella sp.]
MFDPWGELKQLRHITIEWRRPHPLAPAATDGQRIWIDPAATQTERRCLLAHELVHVEERHRGCQPAAVERAVRLQTARRLIRLEDLASHMPWTRHPAELAESLWVTEQVLLDRLAGLWPHERRALDQLELQPY